MFVNGMPFGRVGDLHTCSAKIEKGSTNVHVGGGTVTTDKIDPEIPAWVNWTLGAIGLASAIVLAGGPLVAALGTAGGIGGGMGGEWLGGKLFGEGSDGQKLMMLGGGLLGGALGAKGGNALAEGLIPRPTSAAAAFVKGGAPEASELTPAMADQNKISNLVDKGDIDGAREVLKPYVDNGDVQGVIDRLDVSSPKDGGYLWSGSKSDAANIATNRGGVTLETTTGGRVVDDWTDLNTKFEWPPGATNPPGEQFWGGLSNKYAEGLSGDVTALQTPDKVGGGYVFKTYEQPAVEEGLASGRITSFNQEIINPKPSAP